MEDVRKLNWFPVKENVELEILTLAHNSLYDEAFPEYLKLNLHQVSAYNLIKIFDRACPFDSKRNSYISTFCSNRSPGSWQQLFLISSQQLSEIIVITVFLS